MSEIPFAFKTSGIQFVPVPDDFAYGNGEAFHLVEPARVDDEGIVASLQAGGVYHSPVRMVVELLGHLQELRRTGDERHLHAAIAHAERLILEAEVVGDAEFYPYHFPWNLHQLAEFPMEVPWYSGMAQGYAIIAFLRLAALTNSDRYRHHATAAFNSLLQRRQQDQTWVTDLLDGEYVWFEEYARNKGESDRTINGHLYTVFALQEYYFATGDKRARELADGGLTTILAIMDRWRIPGRMSTYCLTHNTFTATYHSSHCHQLIYCYIMTADPIWLQFAEAFIHDWPVTVFSRDAAGKLIVPPGIHTVGTSLAYDIETREDIEVTDYLELDWDVRLNERTELQTYIRSVDDRYRNLLFREGDCWVEGEVDNFQWPHPVELEPAVRNPRWFLVVDGLLVQQDPPNLPLRSTGRAAINGMHAFRIESDDNNAWWIPREDVRIAPGRNSH